MNTGRFVYDVWTYSEEKDYTDSMCRLTFAGHEICRVSLNRRGAKAAMKELDREARRTSDGIGYAYMVKRYQPHDWNGHIQAAYPWQL